MEAPKNHQPPEALVAYVPALHAGYMDLFERHKDKPLYVVDQDILAELPDLRKDVRALEPAKARLMVERLKIFRTVALLGKASITHLVEQRLVMPDDDVSEHLEENYVGDRFIRKEPTFLRWDRKAVYARELIEPDMSLPSDQIDEQIINTLEQEKNRSSDWWRRVGAVVRTKQGQITSHNRHLPTAHTPHIDGDPRMYGSRGENRDATTAIHAEADIVAEAARRGVSLEESELYVSTFPCPSCAKLIAQSGIKTVYFFEGYAMVDGAKALRDRGVELISVEGRDLPLVGPSKPYPEK